MPVLVRLVVSQQARDRAERTLLHLQADAQAARAAVGSAQYCREYCRRACLGVSARAFLREPHQPLEHARRAQQLLHLAVVPAVDMQRTACGVQRATNHMQRATCNMQRVTCTVQHGQMHLCESVRELPDQLGRSYDAGVIAVVEDPHQRLSQTNGPVDIGLSRRKPIGARE